MEEHDISTCVLSPPASGNNATGQEARDIARRTNEVLAEIISKHRREGTISRELASYRSAISNRRPLGYDAGWVEPHFSSSFGLVPPGVIVVYTARDEHEVAICRSLFWVSNNFNFPSVLGRALPP
jgi:hypothetical protein